MGRELEPFPPETAPPSAGEAGFSLIELVVVTAVISVLAVGAGLSVARRDASAVAADLARFETAFADARDLAIREHGRRGLRITPQGLTPARFGSDGWSGAAREQRWNGRVAIVAHGPLPPPGAPEVVVLSNGRATAFQITFSASGEPARTCRSDGWTGLTCR
ncbi:hypothetical protein ATO6_23680 [Oceanicola sp. 22II-s10i]|uniref:type II secretion system protein n=1 Tax=Oceanicola sp. 22II-s10i TaxID=1317116 RepID=UPI000B51EE02|nr:type II secretion system protein [Oceanicola sp. 22II-s10i]OWU81685.1 hypothetical protein ATO6_23680 [Oceanicola sp. 22II-s10i]